VHTPGRSAPKALVAGHNVNETPNLSEF
jgi:hypothetical protein